MGRPLRAADQSPASIRDHLANERTLLSWIRTAITVIGLGFVVDRFAVGTRDAGIGVAVGLGLVAVGGLMAIAGAYRFVRTEREIDSATYRPSVTLYLVVTGAVVLSAVGVAAFVLLEG